jgi:hypothetical protein
MITAAPNEQFRATIDNAPTGLAGVMGVQILDANQNPVVARTTVGIVEGPAGSGFYGVTLTAPAIEGDYTVFWDSGTVTPTTTTGQDLVVVSHATPYFASSPTPDIGPITNRIRTYIPATYDALSRATTVMGPELLQFAIDTVKHRLTGTVVSATTEVSYDPFIQDYIAKVATLRIIPAGADYWSDQLTGESAREETINYPDRIASLWRIHERLLLEMRQDQPFFERWFPSKLRRGPLGIPRIDTDRDLLTLDPAKFWPETVWRRFRSPGEKVASWEGSTVQWGSWG